MTAWLAWQWYIGELSGLVPIVVGIVMISAFSAFRRIEEYKLWQREWNAMDGHPPPPRRLRRLRGNLVLRLLIGLPLWCLGAYGALHAGNDPLTQIAAGLFWIGSSIIVAAAGYRLVMHRKTSAKQVIRDVPVSICVSLPRGSATASDAFALLPNYCRLTLSVSTNHSSH